MKSEIKKLPITALILLFTALLPMTVQAAETRARDTGTIHTGVYADTVELSGMTKEQAKQAVSAYVEGLKSSRITLTTVNDFSVEVTAGELGLSWSNEDIVDDALALGKRGNVIARYKALKDLEHETKVLDVEISFDNAAIENVVHSQCTQYNVPAENASITRTNGKFEIIPGKTGYVLNTAASIETIAETLNSGWEKADTEIHLEVDEKLPQGKEEDLAKIKDVLGTFTTSYSTSSSNRSTNVANGAALINGTVLYPGEEFSAYAKVSPFSEENGYAMAGSYLNGMVVESLGGGICQVTSTLYNAVLRSELEVTERFNHSMIVSYVQLSADAAISGTAKDFKFKNNQEYPIYIEAITRDKKVTFTIYGVETRPSGREVIFESEELERNDPVAEKIIADAGKPVGYIDVQSAHIGYKGKLWKVVKENGVEVERTQINSSNYAASPRTATVGIAADNPEITATMQAAVATGSIDYCKSVIANLRAAAEAAAAMQVPIPPPIVVEDQ